MGHKWHFLERLERVDGVHVERALSLYYSRDRARHVIERAMTPERAMLPEGGLGEGGLGGGGLGEGARVAIALEYGARPPHVVVTADGTLVTCLGAGMSTGDLPVIAHERFAALTLEFDALEARRQRLETLKAEERNVFSPLHQDADLMPRETFEGLLAVAPWLQMELLMRSLKARDQMVDELVPLAREVRRAQRGQRSQRRSGGQREVATRETLMLHKGFFHKLGPRLTAYWRMAWDATHSSLLAFAEEPATLTARITEALERVAPRDDDNPIRTPSMMLRALAWALTRQGTLSFLLRGLWLAGQMGEAIMEAQVRSLEGHRTNLGAMLSVYGLGVMALRDPSLRRSVMAALRDEERRRTPMVEETPGFMKWLCESVRKQLTMSKRKRAATREFAVTLGRDYFAALEAPRVQAGEEIERRVADASEAEAITMFTLIPFDTLSLRSSIFSQVQWMLPWVARAQAEDFYLPRAYAQLPGCEQPVYCAGMMLSQAAVTAPVAARKRERVGRNDPCPCGSGRKHKQCCINRRR